MGRYLIFLLFYLFSAATLIGQMPKMIKNIGPKGTHGINVGWDYPNVFANASGKLLFWGTDESYGTELWVTDGSYSGTTLVKDIVPGPGSPEVIHSYYKQNDRGVYFALGNIGSMEIWFSDGTVENTKRLFLEDAQHRLDIYHPTGANRSAVVFNNIFLLGTVIDSSITKRCIYKLEPENELTNPADAIFWKDSLSFYLNHSGISEVCEFKGQLLAVAEAATYGGLIAINRDFATTTWLLKTNIAINHLRNVNNEYLAFRYPDLEESVACIKDINSPSLQILTSPGNFAALMEDAQVSKVVSNKLFFFKDQQLQQLWVTDGSAEGTRLAPFQGISRIVGTHENSVVIVLQNINDGLFSLISWDGGPFFQTISTDQGALNLNTTRHQVFAERQYLFSPDLFVLLNERSYRIFGNPNPGDSTRLIFTHYTVPDSRNLIGDNLVLSGWNNTLVGENSIGQEPFIFPLGIKLWTGVVSANWHDSQNWHPVGVPSNSESVLIPETPNSNYPTLSQDGICRDLFVNFGGVTIEKNAALTITGELSNYWAVNGDGNLLMTADNPAIITGPGEYSVSHLNFTSGNFHLQDEPKTLLSKLVLGINTKIFLNDFDLRLNGNLPDPILNYSLNSYIVSNGTGSLSIQNLGSNTDVGTQQVFPVGRSSYNPVMIKYEGFIPATFTVNVVDDAFEGGYDGNEITVSNIDRTWDVKKIEGDQTSTNILLQWQSNEELPGFNRDSCFVRHYVEDKWENGTAGRATTQPNGLYGIEMPNISTFSPFTVSSDLTALPLRLLTFTANENEGLIELQWATQSEINVSHFEVEYSYDSRKFEKIGSIQGKNVGFVVETYFYIHKSNKGKHFYRLKIVDKDGTFFYSKIISASLHLNTRLEIYPNPASSHLIISSPASSPIQSVLITNMFGQVIFKKLFSSKSNLYFLDLRIIPKGIYQIEIGFDGLKEVYRFVKQ